jgi:hypothetical protein
MVPPGVVWAVGVVQPHSASGYAPPRARSRMIEKPWSMAWVRARVTRAGHHVTRSRPAARGWPAAAVAPHPGTRELPSQ